MRMQLEYSTIGEGLIASIPEFTDIYKEHVKYYDEVIPHLLFGEFTRFFLDVYSRSKDDSVLDDVVNRSLNFIELCFLSNDPKVDELAHVSFLENLLGEPDYEDIKKRLMPISLKHLEMIEHPKKV